MFPNFLGIGAQKAGTTWLYANLRLHPQIWMPPIKELHFLDCGRTPLAQRLFSDAKRLKKARSYLREQIWGLPAGGRLGEVAWALRYCLAPRTDAWYRSLFPEIPGKMTGEISPGYAKLRGEAVGRIHRLMPDAKVIYLLRNPIERSWSYAVQHFANARWKGRYGSVDDVAEQELLAFLTMDRSEGHSDYLGALAAWERHYGQNQLFVGFFDELTTNPRALLKGVLDFLGVDSGDDVTPATVRKNPNPGRGVTIPSELQAYLIRLHHDQLVGLHAKFNNSWTSAWLASAEMAFAADHPPWRAGQSARDRH